jgi:hypothetical protein
VYLTYTKEHRVDLDIAADKPTRFDHLQKKLKFIGNLDKNKTTIKRNCCQMPSLQNIAK